MVDSHPQTRPQRRANRRQRQSRLRQDVRVWLTRNAAGRPHFSPAWSAAVSHDLNEVARRLDRYPNFFVDCAARTRDLTRQPREKARNFIIKYEDRILYGVDSTWKPLRGTIPPTDQQRASLINGLEKKYRADYAFYAGACPTQYD